MTYQEFLEKKIVLAEDSGFDVDVSEINQALYPFQRDMVVWALRGGRRAIFASFGLGKSSMQIEFCHQVVKRFGGKAMIVLPLGVRQEFKHDAVELLGYAEPRYCRDMNEVKAVDGDEIIITNYERVRDGDIDPGYFVATSLDEAAVLRSYGSKTYQTFLDKFFGVPYKLVATATPSPNKFKELIHYAGYLEVMDTGEALAPPLSEPVLTPFGYKPMGEIEVGDSVIGKDGKPAFVTGIYPQGVKEIYTIRFSDGAITRCTGDHLWTTQTQYERNNCKKFLERNHGGDTYKYWSTKTTEEIINTLYRPDGGINHSIPMVSPVEFEEREVTIDPWLMGYLLGNGNFRETSVNVSTSDLWVADRIDSIVKKYGLDLRKNPHARRNGNRNYDYSITAGADGRTGRGHHSNYVLNAIREYGLIGKRAWEKFVPDSYWFNSPDVRLGVLRGLMDSDGTITNNSASFLTTSPMLVDYVRFCVQSFGGTVNVTERIGRKPDGENGRLQYKVAVRMPDNVNPFLLPRKADKVFPRSKYRPIRYIEAIERCGEEECQCIMVSNSDHLYVTTDFIVTHNTRFFQRDSTKANNLTLYPAQEEAFWMWLSSWALFVEKPSDLDPSYSDDGYELPELTVNWHCLSEKYFEKQEKDGQMLLFQNSGAGLKEAAEIKRDSQDERISFAKQIIDESPDDHFVIWHDLESERNKILKAIPGTVDIYGSMDYEKREQRVMDFSYGKTRLFATKKSLSGVGCNFQRYCHRAIFVGIDYAFHDFIQACHRIHRFLQSEPVVIDIIYMESEQAIKDALQEKWKNHNKMVAKMTEIVQKYGLTDKGRFERLRKKMGVDRLEVSGDYYKAVNVDCVQETRQMPDNCVDLIHTSIPFGNHYEYSPNYADFGNNDDDESFFEQMDYLTPELLRVLKPGRVAAIHVKDRVMFGNATGLGFPTVEPFHMLTTQNFMRHGFEYFGMITIITDVVRENNQTYRLGWTENCKDSTKMGVGMPEYVLLFRKTPTDRTKAYADTPVTKTKEEYTRAQWQIDAHGFWRTNGDRLISRDELFEITDHKILQKVYREYSRNTVYSYEEHVALAKKLDEQGKLPTIYMVVAPGSWHMDVWDDINRMQTLNTTQSRRRQQLHVCPLQTQVVERIINRYSNKGELVYDPFAGIFTVPSIAVKMGRKGYGCELNEDYFRDGVGYCDAAESEVTTPTLFDFLDVKGRNYA